jgi:hypothetical protein
MKRNDEGGFDIDDTEARLIALDVVIVGIKTQHLPGWEEYPGLSQEAWWKVDGEVDALCNRMEDWQRQLADQHGIDLDALMAGTEEER